MENEKRLIDANPLIEMFSGGESMKSISESIHDERFVAELRNAPTVDAVDVDKALEWLEGYTITDTEKVYTNGTVMVPLFRVKQALKDKAYNGLLEG